MGTYEISVDHRFRARHAIVLGDGEWEESHEHEWLATATFRCDELEPVTGVVVDFLDVTDALKEIGDGLEGRDLNQIGELAEGATAERVAWYLARRLARILGPDGDKLYRVCVTEAPGCRAAYYPSGPGDLTLG
ncbi:MAG: 6-pyruvoyl tetrahydropterin synthase [Planctomycetes bacterium ADurb.Bin126]|nr:MAG: 6-pyruvoyl tetrahydropterin synthase [Planctomycetes bacterium ADurb.Bin126]HOD80634.1 6-carboxytetrahydropterin synthase [Phycisphaerae bacterium]HQL73920.1 6-carboxytetrahydropterin synthase [Phycisphaerae bacterium]